MKKRALKLVAFSMVVACTVLLGLTANNKTRVSTGAGETSALSRAYEQWRAANVNSNGEVSLNIHLGWMRGLSSENVKATGTVSIDMADHKLMVDVAGLPKGDWQLWFIENVENNKNSTLPDASDKMVSVASFSSDGQDAKYQGQMGADLLSNLNLDRVAITRAGKNPAEAFVLTGSLNLFERLERNQVQIVRNEQSPKGWWQALASLLPATSVSASGSSLDALIAQGEQIFNKEKFAGNGRTCATCHPEDNNFTIDPSYIAKLPPTDALFVAEFNGNLANKFENSALLRQYGLILENVDGFDDLTNKFVLRSVPHLLGLKQTITAPDPLFVSDFTTNGRNPNPVNRLGWGGDGSFGSGSLREFAIGAVIQHFTKRLNRQAGVDFRLPNDAELDAMAAYQLSLGRQEELNFTTIQMKDSVAASGRTMYMDTGNFGEPGHKNCNACHFNGGSNVAFGNNPTAPGFSPKLDGNPRGFNGSQGTNVDLIPQALSAGLPRDGGFGRIPLPFGSFGNFGDVPGIGTIPAEEFNSPSVIESADTGPYFHNHMATTLEDAIAFYGSPAFQSLGSVGGPGGPVPVTISSNPNSTEVRSIGAFLRSVNSVDNIRSTINFIKRAQTASGDDRKELIKLAIADNADAIKVLLGGAYQSSRSNTINVAVAKLNVSIGLLLASANLNSTSAINGLLNSALPVLRDARGDIVNPSTLPASYQN